MTTVSNFIDEQNKFERKLANFMGWKFVENQKKGSSYDCITSNGQKVELKMDDQKQPEIITWNFVKNQLLAQNGCLPGFYTFKRNFRLLDCCQ